MKWLFIGFIIIQVGVDLAHSVTAFPFVHYGMFSESFARPDSFAIFEVTTDGKLLQASDFRIYRWDMIQSPLAAFEKQSTTNDFAFDKQKTKEELSRLGLRGLYTAIAPRLDNPGADSTTSRLDNPGSIHAQFPAWYKAYLSRLLNHPVGILQVDKAWYRYEDGQLRRYRTEKRIHL